MRPADDFTIYLNVEFHGTIENTRKESETKGTKKASKS